MRERRLGLREEAASWQCRTEAITAVQPGPRARAWTGQQTHFLPGLPQVGKVYPLTLISLILAHGSTYTVKIIKILKHLSTFIMKLFIFFFEQDLKIRISKRAVDLDQYSLNFLNFVPLAINFRASVLYLFTGRIRYKTHLSEN